MTIGAVLAAIAGGAGGGLGGQLWAGVRALAARPFGHRTGPQAADTESGSAQLAALEQAPADQQRAVALAEVLVARAAADGEFTQALAAWWEQARHVPAAGNVTNTISGGLQYGPVIQGRGIQVGVPVSAAQAAGGQQAAGHVFISYVREDSDHVDRLQRALQAAGIPVWRDTADLWPGEDWRGS